MITGDIYIAKDHNGEKLALIYAKSRELALAYLQGKDIHPHKLSSFSTEYTAIDNHPTGVIPVILTKEIPSYEIYAGTTVRVIDNN